MISTFMSRTHTYRPTTKKDQKADACRCPIWCRGYLAKETKILRGKLRAKRIFASLDTDDWTAAEKEVARLYERGSLPPIESALRQIDNTAINADFHPEEDQKALHHSASRSRAANAECPAGTDEGRQEIFHRPVAGQK
jgi:hypothetical protein